jgi:hypothetical protein
MAALSTALNIARSVSQLFQADGNSSPEHFECRQCGLPPQERCCHFLAGEVGNFRPHRAADKLCSTNACRRQFRGEQSVLEGSSG